MCCWILSGTGVIFRIIVGERMLDGFLEFDADLT